MMSTEFNAARDLTNELKELQARNDTRRKEAIDRLGSKWLLHPDNKIDRKDDSSVMTMMQNMGITKQ
jgi:hypothetical protein